MKGYMLDRYYRRKAAAIKQLGGKCVRCGGVEELQFDHIERAGKGWSIGNRLAGVSEKRLQEELAKCQLLCGQCHKEKTTTEPDQYNSYVRECCGKQWTGRQYAGHRSWNHTSRRNSIWQKP